MQKDMPWLGEGGVFDLSAPTERALTVEPAMSTLDRSGMSGTAIQRKVENIMQFGQKMGRGYRLK